MRVAWAVALCIGVMAAPVWAQKGKPKELRNGTPLTRDEIINNFTLTTIVFGGGDFPPGCEVLWGGNYGVGTTVTKCGQVDGRYSAWAWGGNELRFVARGGVARQLYFYRRPDGQYYVLDERGNYAEIALIRR